MSNSYYDHKLARKPNMECLKDVSFRLQNCTSALYHCSPLESYHNMENLRQDKKRAIWVWTSSSRSITRLSWAPTGDFRTLYMRWSLCISSENLTAGVGVLALTKGAAAATPFWAGLGLLLADTAILMRVDWHLSCCFLNLSNFSCNAIWKKKQMVLHNTRRVHQNLLTKILVS